MLMRVPKRSTLRRSFHPVVSALEGRVLLAGGVISSSKSPVHLQPVKPVRPADTQTSWISTVPVPGDSPLPRGVPLAQWLLRHQQFMTHIRRQRDDVLFLGDSMTEGWWGAGKPVWTSQFAPLRAAEFGIHGDQTQNLLWRIVHGELSGKPRVAVVMIGFNNLAKGQSPEETAAGITAVVSAIQNASPRTKILLLGILPCGPDPGTPGRAAIAQVNASISRLAGGSVTYLDIGPRFLQPDGTISPLILTGYVHPTQAGYQIFAGAIRSTVLRLLRQ